MTFIQEQQMEAREKLTTPWDYYNDCEGTQQCLVEEDLDTLITQTITNTLQKLLDSGVLEEKDVNGEHTCDIVYKTPPQDGESVTYTHINYDERKGHNTAVRAVKKELEALII